MSPFTARCVLVVTAVVLVLSGLLGPVAGSGRVALLAAAACCAVLDVVLHRSTTSAEPEQAGEPLPLPLLPHLEQADLASTGFVLGHRPEGAVVLHPAPAHLVVVGTGAVADSVFRALAAQLAAGPAADDHAAGEDGAGEDGADDHAAGDDGVAPRTEGSHQQVADPHGPARTVRWGSDPDRDPPVRPCTGSGSGSSSSSGTSTDRVGRMPPGTAAAVRFDDAGRPASTVVHVPGLGAMPRTWDVAVVVSRYGCTSRRPADPAAEPLVPVLPVAPDPDPDPDQDPDPRTSGTSGTSVTPTAS
ncbi:hypothetical protein DEI99_009825 [Curtobacterium sp. MCLR17_036]|uniref:hypothetical protein n=1 Tax=Curtobacterium sp. MCLR17_036 TaxID=2175620 RepID=UPI000DAAA9A1|nr:hypothetical protein [Curtobacterium sp. MCLR17_036]WIE63560.1 hypothetical protein DEI99_009825 [Curtobacterium sp. MCLR17_036]